MSNDRKNLIAAFLTALAPSERARLVAIIERKNEHEPKKRTKKTRAPAKEPGNNVVLLRARNKSDDDGEPDPAAGDA